MRQVLKDRKTSLEADLEGLKSQNMQKFGTESQINDLKVRLDEIRYLLKKAPKKSTVRWQLDAFDDDVDVIYGRNGEHGFREVFGSFKLLYGFRLKRAKRRIKRKLNYLK